MFIQDFHLISLNYVFYFSSTTTKHQVFFCGFCLMAANHTCLDCIDLYSRLAFRQKGQRATLTKPLFSRMKATPKREQAAPTVCKSLSKGCSILHRPLNIRANKKHHCLHETLQNWLSHHPSGMYWKLGVGVLLRRVAMIPSGRNLSMGSVVRPVNVQACNGANWTN